MTDLAHFSLTVFMGFFAIMNPIALTPIFLSLVESKSQKTKKEIAKTACITAFIVVVIFVILGKYIFSLFGLSIPAFKITGGILIFYVGFEMLMSKPSKIQSANIETIQENEVSIIQPNTIDDSQDNALAICPLAIPILSGPGTIVTAMNHAAAHPNYLHIIIIVAIFAIITAMTYLAFIASNVIIKLVGERMILVISKLMGLILAIIGTGMAITGIQIAFNL